MAKNKIVRCDPDDFMMPDSKARKKRKGKGREIHVDSSCDCGCDCDSSAVPVKNVIVRCDSDSDDSSCCCHSHLNDIHDIHDCSCRCDCSCNNVSDIIPDIISDSDSDSSIKNVMVRCDDVLSMIRERMKMESGCGCGEDINDNDSSVGCGCSHDYDVDYQDDIYIKRITDRCESDCHCDDHFVPVDLSVRADHKIDCCNDMMIGIGENRITKCGDLTERITMAAYERICDSYDEAIRVIRRRRLAIGEPVIVSFRYKGDVYQMVAVGSGCQRNPYIGCEVFLGIVNEGIYIDVSTGSRRRLGEVIKELQETTGEDLKPRVEKLERDVADISVKVEGHDVSIMILDTSVSIIEHRLRWKRIGTFNN